MFTPKGMVQIFSSSKTFEYRVFTWFVIVISLSHFWIVFLWSLEVMFESIFSSIGLGYMWADIGPKTNGC